MVAVRILCACVFLVVATVGPAAGQVCGDADGNGTVTAADGVETLRTAAGLASGCGPTTCDVDASGVITDTDAVNVLRAGTDLPATLACPPSPLAVLEAKLATRTWLAYAPTGFDPSRGCPAGFPDEASIRTDLETARAHGFDGLVTFGADCTLAAIPEIARAAGFDAVIMGLFLFNATLRAEEVANATTAAVHVDGYGIGNEGLIGCGGDLYDAATLLETMDELRATTGKPVTTSEQIEDYLGGGCLDGFLLTHGDWLFPITHPFNNEQHDPAAGVAFTVDRFEQVNALSTKTVFFKEVGWPTAGDPAATEANQAAFFAGLSTTAVRFAFFEGFDQPAKASFPLPWEPFWGLFGQGRTPKTFVAGGS